MSKRIGLVGEDPNDTIAINNLLSRSFGKHKFVSLLKRIRGSQLDSEKAQKLVKTEYDSKKPDIIIFIRDADDICTNEDRIAERTKWFKKLSKGLPCKNIFLLNIYELEALILADIDTFNSLYKTHISYTKSVMHEKDPKGFLRKKTEKLSKKYEESDAPKIFEHLDIEVLKKRCDYFNEFLKGFTKALSA